MLKFFVLFLSFALLMQLVHLEECSGYRSLKCKPFNRAEVDGCCEPYTCHWLFFFGMCK
nr:venom peptide [Acharia stimulea]